MTTAQLDFHSLRTLLASFIRFARINTKHADYNYHDSYGHHGPMSTTTIQIETDVRDLLRARGRMGESYNDVIRRLLSMTHSRDFDRPELAGRLPGQDPKPLFVHQDRK